MGPQVSVTWKPSCVAAACPPVLVDSSCHQGAHHNYRLCWHSWHKPRAAGPPLPPWWAACWWALLLASSVLPEFVLIPTPCYPANPHSLQNISSHPTLPASINHRGSRQHPSPWNWEWEVNKWLDLPQKSEFVRKDNVGWSALLNKRCEDILQEKVSTNHLGTSVMTTRTT